MIWGVIPHHKVVATVRYTAHSSHSYTDWCATATDPARSFSRTSRANAFYSTDNNSKRARGELTMSGIPKERMAKALEQLETISQEDYEKVKGLAAVCKPLRSVIFKNPADHGMTPTTG
jgi:hypothetical protein